ncbi:MAG TPA: alpha/beta hydrolase, partial [Puia sp.]|nr:alpha/beta hydrolase [Puia sp.]
MTGSISPPDTSTFWGFKGSGNMKTLLWTLWLVPLLTNTREKGYQREVISLYSDTIPNATGKETKESIAGDVDNPLFYFNVSHPTITVYLPDKQIRKDAAVIIFPGGAYKHLAFLEEGTNIAQAFVKHGITAVVVKYRLPDDVIMRDKSIGPLQDAQQAIKLVRMHAGQWGISDHKIGIMGFSAGGHLAATAGTHFNHNYIPNEEGVDLKPDFMILVYPVISMSDSLTHMDSRRNLLGVSPSQAQLKLFS